MAPKSILAINVGKKAFDIEFEALTKDFQKFRLTVECKNDIYIAQTNFIHQWEQTLNAMLDHKRGARWANRKINDLMNRQALSQEVVSYLRKMISHRSGDITVEYQIADKWEIEQIMAANPRLRYEEAKLGTKTISHLDNIEVLYPENNLQDLFIKQAQTKIRALKECDITNCSLTRLQELKKYVYELSDNLSECQSTLDKAKRFLTHANLGKLLEVFDEGTPSHTALKGYLDNLYK